MEMKVERGGGRGVGMGEGGGEECTQPSDLVSNIQRFNVDLQKVAGRSIEVNTRQRRMGATFSLQSTLI